MPTGQPGSGLVDCHSHFYPRWYLDALRARERAPRVVVHDGQERFQAFPAEPPPASPGPVGQPVTPGFYELGEKIAFMDAHGIGRSLVSVGNPWADIAQAEASVELAGRLNGEVGGLVDGAGGRVLGLGVLPNADVAACIRTAESIADDRRFVGVIAGLAVGGLVLDDPALTPLWSALAEHELTLLVHPSNGCSDWDLFAGHGHVLPLGIGFLVESATAAVRLALSGTVENTGLRVVLPHAGGVLPVVTGRVAALTNLEPPALFVDSIAASDAAWQAAVTSFGADRIVFGSDHPFLVGGTDALATAKARLSVAQTTAAALAAFPRAREV